MRELQKAPEVSGTQNSGTGPCKAILGLGFPLHKPYIQLIKVSISILGIYLKCFVKKDDHYVTPLQARRSCATRLLWL